MNDMRYIQTHFKPATISEIQDRFKQLSIFDKYKLQENRKIWQYADVDKQIASVTRRTHIRQPMTVTIINRNALFSRKRLQR